MNLELIPMLILTLLLISSEGTDVQTAELILSGDHRIARHPTALIVGDADVTIPPDADVTGPVYVIGGTVRLEGTVRSRLTQVAGTLVVDDTATLGGLRHIGGTQTVSDAAEIRRRSDVQLVPADRNPLLAALPSAITTLLLAVIGARLARAKRDNVDTVARAIASHPVISLTVGVLLSVTFLALFVFMAFTLVLIPVSLLGLLTGLLAIGFGVIAWGHRVGRHTTVRRPGLATALGVVVVMVALQLVGLVPVVGDLVVAFVVLSGLGAVVITYVGFAEFTPAELPD